MLELEPSRACRGSYGVCREASRTRRGAAAAWRRESRRIAFEFEKTAQGVAVSDVAMCPWGSVLEFVGVVERRGRRPGRVKSYGSFCVAAWEGATGEKTVFEVSRCAVDVGGYSVHVVVEIEFIEAEEL